MNDADGDGWGDDAPPSGASVGSDCDDARSDVAPDASDTPWDGRDQDCDGVDAGSTVTATGDGRLPILDYYLTRSDATLGRCDTIYGLTVSVNIRHTYIGDLTVEVEGPDRTNITLHNRAGGAADDIVGTYSTGSGTLTASESLSGLVGHSGTGTWSLLVADTASGDSGTVESWSLSVLCP
jgi:subtilisin-like proprotein convertase family protein